MVVKEKLSRKQAVEGWLDAWYCSILEVLGGGEGVSGIVLTGPGDGSSVLQVARIVQRGGPV